MELEVGMYVRTIKGKIWIITSQKAISGHRKDIIKASHNIIDLIEELDIIEFINGSVLRIESISDKYICFLSQDNDCAGIFFDKETLIKDIRSIVTKEMFSSVEYRMETN